MEQRPPYGSHYATETCHINNTWMESCLDSICHLSLKDMENLVCLWWECPHHFPCTPGKSYFQCVGPCFLWDNVTHSKMPRSERWKEACPVSLLNLEEGVSREPTDHRKWARVLEKLLVQSIWAWNHYFNVLCAPVSIHSIITHCLMFSKKK